MDDVDRQLLSLLRANSRESFTSLAESVGTSEGTVRARMKRLISDGVIEKFTIKTVGNQVKALVEVSVDQNINTTDVAREIKSWEGVESVWEITGDLDIVVVADCHDTVTLNQLIDRIRDIEGTAATRSRLILKAV